MTKKRIIYAIGVLIYFSGCTALNIKYGTMALVLGALCGIGAIIYTTASHMK